MQLVFQKIKCFWQKISFLELIWGRRLLSTLVVYYNSHLSSQLRKHTHLPPLTRSKKEDNILVLYGEFLRTAFQFQCPFL